MKVLTVNTWNLDKLYEICVKKVNEFQASTKFGYNMYEMYNNIEISFGLTDVSPIDAFFLKEISFKSSSLVDIDIDYRNLDFDPVVRRYANFIHEVMEEKSITTKEKYDYPYNHGPAHIIRGNMSVTLTGSRLLPILSEDPVSFFLQATSGTCANNDSGPITFKKDFNLNDANISAFLAKAFVDFFNRRMNVKFSSTDDISDMGLHKFFIQHDENVKLVSIRHPYLSIDFRTMKAEYWKGMVNEFKGLMKDSFYAEMNKRELELTEFEVNCYSTVGALLSLYEILPKRFFTVIEDMRIPFSFKEIYIPESYPEKIASTLLKRYEELQTTIDNLQTSAYDKISHTYLNARISYTLKLSLEDINLYINQILMRNDLRSEVKTILNQIIKFSKAVYKTVH